MLKDILSERDINCMVKEYYHDCLLKNKIKMAFTYDMAKNYLFFFTFALLHLQ